jgi:hypothetical protein
MLAWGPMKGYTSGRHSLAETAALAQQKGYEWVVLELDDPATEAYNRSIWNEYVAAFHARGILAGCWFTEGGSIYKTPGNADLAIAELEGPGDYEGIMNVIKGAGGGSLPSCPLAICTNFNTPLQSREAARPLIDAGFTCLVEAYLNENPNATPDSMDRIARDLGWPTSQPVFGVYPVEGKPAPSYAQWADWPGVDYLGEYVL